MELEKWKQQLLDNMDLFIGDNTTKRSAVLIPLVEVDGEWCPVRSPVVKDAIPTGRYLFSRRKSGP